MKKFFLIICLVSILNTGNSQIKNDPGSWTTLNGKISGNRKLSGYMELQLRSLSLYDRFYYYEIKGGATYNFDKNFSFTLGTGLYQTFNEGPDFDHYSKQTEVRVWEQFEMKQQLSFLNLEHRYRIEQRFTENYKNRFRYRLNVSVPINNKTMVPKTVYGVVNNELFFADKAPHFSRNRFHTGAGYILSEQLTIQAGLLRQVDYLMNDDRKKNYVFTSFSFKF